MLRILKNIGWTIVVVAGCLVLLAACIAVIPFLLGLGSIAIGCLVIVIIYNVVANRDDLF